MRIAALVLSLAVVACSEPADGSAEWSSELFEKQDTLEFLTVAPGEQEHWSTVWVVVVDGQPYLRLGTRAAGRIEKNTTAPLVKVRVAGRVFEPVRAEPAPEMAERVAAAMGEKYWSDVLVRYASHPLTVRLVPEPPKQTPDGP